MKKFRTTLVIKDLDNGEIDIQLNVPGVDTEGLREEDLSPALALAFFTKSYALEMSDLSKTITSEDIIKILKDNKIKPI